MKTKIENIVSKRGYAVTEDGVFLNPKGENVGSIGSVGRIRTKIKVDKKQIVFYSHRLQAFQKYGNKMYEKGIMVRHKNGNPLDNSWDNILIGTASDNMMDIPEQIRIKKALHASSFLKKYNNEEVVKFYKECKSYKKTMEKFCIPSKGTLHYILNRLLYIL